MAFSRFVARLLAGLIYLSASLPLGAKTLTFQEQKCHVDVPDDWTERQVAGDQAAFINSDRTKSFILRIDATGLFLTLSNPSFIKGLEGSIASHGGAITDRKYVKVADVDAYTVDSTGTAPSGVVYNETTVILANGFGYGVDLSKLNAKPSDDAELRGIMNSFGFIGEPTHHQSRADNLSDRLGQITGACLGAIAVLSIFRWWRKRKAPGSA